MTLIEATEWIKHNFKLELASNTLRKACATGRLKGLRKGEGTMHIRRTEWEVTQEAINAFMQEEYHPRPSRRGKPQDKLHIPNNHIPNNKDTKPKTTQNRESNNKVQAKIGTRVFYRVVEHLFQTILSIHGSELAKYDTRVVEAKIPSKAKAEAMAQKLEAAARTSNLSHQLRYEVEAYTGSKK